MGKVNDEQVFEEIYSYIKQNQYCYLATVLEKQPKIRPMVLFYHKNRFWMITFTNDSKVAQLKKNKLCEVCIPVSDHFDNKGYIKLTGQANIVKDYDLKYDASHFCYFFDEYYNSADDPDFTLIELVFSVFEIVSPGDIHGKKVTV